MNPGRASRPAIMAFAGAGLIGAVIVTASCSAPDQTRTTGRVGSSGYEALTRLAQAGPVPGREALIEPPFPELREIDRGAADWALHNASLEEVVSSWPASDDASPPAPADRDAATRALMLYAEARQRAADEDLARAIRLLEEAAELDPGSAEVWRALGDARRLAGFANSSGAAYDRAAELGLAEPEALVFAGVHAAGRAAGPNEQRAAAGRFVRAVTAPVPHADPLVRDVALVFLGESLLGLGETRAGCEALEQGLRIPAAARMPTNLGAQALSIRRRLGELHSALGDGWCRLGEFDRAAAAFQRAVNAPEGAGPSARARLLYALRRVGHPAAAALVLIEDLDAGAALSPSTMQALADVAESIRPRRLVADAILGLDDRGSATRRINLILARAAALPAGDGQRLLAESLTAPEAPVVRHGQVRLLEALAAVEPDEAVGSLAAVVAAAPGLARPAASVLLETDADPSTLPARLEALRDRAARWALLASLALETNNRASLERSLAEPFDPADPASLLSLRAGVAAALGRWDVADDAPLALQAAAQDPSSNGTRWLLDALESVQRFSLAEPIAEALGKSGSATTDDLLRHAALAGQIGDPAAARSALDRALEADPADERVYAALLALHGPAGPSPDADRRNEAGRLLRQNAPDAPLLRQLFAAEMVRRGLLDEAGARLADLFNEGPTEPQTLEAMLALWTRLVAAERAAEIDLAPVESAVAKRPGSAGLVRLLAGGLMLLDRDDEAAGVIEAFEARTGSTVISRLREQIVRDAMDDPDRASRLALERLGPPPHSIDSTLELATVLARELDGTPEADAAIGRAFDALRAVPAGAELTAGQAASVAGVLASAATHLQARRDAAPDADATAAAGRSVLEMIDWSAGRSLPMAPGIHELRLTLLVERRADLARVADAADRAIEAYPSSRQAFARRLAELLAAASRSGDALTWIAGAAFDPGGTLRTDVVAEWARLVILTAETDHARALIDALISRDAVLATWTALRPAGGELAERDGSSPAELAYLLGQYASGSADPGATARFLRLALEYDPRHAWSCNDLGYTMLVEGGPVDEAERLIEIAYEGLPDRPSIIDSLGWVRYHAGKLEDSIDPATEHVRPGAVTLLRRAASLLGDEDDGVVHDHLGDALYASGRPDDAVDAWQRAATLANRALSRMRSSGAAAGVRFREIQALAAAAAMKRNAVQLNQTPEIAPQRGVAADTGRGRP